MFRCKKHLDGGADGQEITEHRAVAALFFLILVDLVVTALVCFAPVPSLNDFY